MASTLSPRGRHEVDLRLEGEKVDLHDDAGDSPSSSASSTRPRASSSVCVRPAHSLSIARMRSRSLLKSGASDRNDDDENERSEKDDVVAGDTTASTNNANTTLPFLPRLAAVFSQATAAATTDKGSSAASSTSTSASASGTTSSGSPSSASNSSKRINLLRSAKTTDGLAGRSSLRAAVRMDSSGDLGADQYDHAQDGQTSTTTAASSTTGPHTLGTNMNMQISSPSRAFAALFPNSSSNSNSKKTGATGAGQQQTTQPSGTAGLPFLPRKRTLSNLFNNLTGNNTNNNSGVQAAPAAVPVASTSKKVDTPPSSADIRNASAAVPAGPAQGLRKGSGAGVSPQAYFDMQHLQHQSNDLDARPRAWSSSSAITTPPVPVASTSGTYINPFASAFATNTGVPFVRPSSPTLKRQQSHLALSIPPTPGAEPAQVQDWNAVGLNGLRPLRGTEEDYKLPSPIREVEEPLSARDRNTSTGGRKLWAFHQQQSTNAYKYPPGASLYPAEIPRGPLASATALVGSLFSRFNTTNSSPSHSSNLDLVPPTTTLSQQRASHHTLSTLLPPILFLCAAFSTSLVIMYFLVSSIPLRIPHNVADIRMQTIALRDYSRKGLSEGFHVSAVLSALFVFKQAFSVPGSILVNILFGSLYGTYAATVCACIFTGVGSVLAYYMARLCAPLVERFVPRALSTTRTALLSGSSSDLFNYLLLARLFPLLPYSLLNIACGVLKVPVKPYFITLVLGSFPYNFVTTQLGDLLGSLANSAEAGNINAIWTWDLCFKLAIASVLSAAPVIFKEQLKSIMGGSSNASPMTNAANKPLDASPILRSRSSLDGAPSHGLEDDVISLQDQPHRLSDGFTEADSVDSYTAPPRLPALAPVLRRDRTDSSASEVFYAPPAPHSRSSSKSHKKQWSFSWKKLRHSLHNESSGSDQSSTVSYSNGTTSAGTVHSSASSFFSSATSRTSLDEETGDTDEEWAREQRCKDERRLSATSLSRSAGSSRQPSIDLKYGRRTASIESARSSPTVAQHNHFSVPYPALAIDRHTITSPNGTQWDRF